MECSEAVCTAYYFRVICCRVIVKQNFPSLLRGLSNSRLTSVACNGIVLVLTKDYPCNPWIDQFWWMFYPSWSLIYFLKDENWVAIDKRWTGILYALANWTSWQNNRFIYTRSGLILSSRPYPTCQPSTIQSRYFAVCNLKDFKVYQEPGVCF